MDKKLAKVALIRGARQRGSLSYGIAIDSKALLFKKILKGLNT
jgi:hypothetical protein